MLKANFNKRPLYNLQNSTSKVIQNWPKVKHLLEMLEFYFSACQSWVHMFRHGLLWKFAFKDLNRCRSINYSWKEFIENQSFFYKLLIAKKLQILSDDLFVIPSDYNDYGLSKYHNCKCTIPLNIQIKMLPPGP